MKTPTGALVGTDEGHRLSTVCCLTPAPGVTGKVALASHPPLSVHPPPSVSCQPLSVHHQPLA